MRRSAARLIFPRTVPSIRIGSLPLTVPSIVTFGPKYVKVATGPVGLSVRGGSLGGGGACSLVNRAIGFLPPKRAAEHNSPRPKAATRAICLVPFQQKRPTVASSSEELQECSGYLSRADLSGRRDSNSRPRAW